MKRIKRFGIVQTAKVAAIIYFCVTGIFMIPLGLISVIFGGFSGMSAWGPWEGALLLFLPFFYGIIAFVFTAIGCLVYNLIAQRIGGIEVEIETANTVADFD